MRSISAKSMAAVGSPSMRSRSRTSARSWPLPKGDRMSTKRAMLERAPGHPDTDRSKGIKTCPSGPAEPGSVLLGMVVEPGQVAYLSPNIPVTAEWLGEIAASGIPIENRMRFACKCMESRCRQWNGDASGGRCGLVDRAVEALSITEGREDLPNCGIRPTCRWYAQHQAKACAACPEVIRRPAENLGVP